jgi:PAS domain S-box-containing protein
MGQIGVPLVGSYDLRLVALSIFIAISASYAALDLGGRLTAARGWMRSAWLAGGAAAMGLGIWSMHFTGMLAFSLPVPVAYHWPTVLLSLFAAIFAAAIALYVVSRKKMGRVQALTGSVLMGLAIVLMHYIGMAAMRLAAECHYNLLLVALSLLIAIIASLAALVLTFDCREDFRGTTLAKVMSATVMGAAIFLMHYTGMMSASFIPSVVLPDLTHAISISSLGLGGIAIGTLVVQGVAILTSTVDRRFAVQAQELQTSERFRQIAAQLERERARLVEAQEVANIGSWEAELPSLNVIWSEQTHRIFETDPSRFHPTRPKFCEFIHPEDRATVDAAFVASLEKPSPSTTEYRIVMPDGRIKILEERWRPFHDEEGKPVRLAGTCRDITERKRAEQELRQAEERIRAILEYSPNWIFLKDTEGRYLLVNREIERVFGISQEQIKGKTDSEIFPAEQAAQYRENDLKVLRAGLTMEFEEIALLEDGPHTSIVQKFPLFDTHGNIYATGGVATDITARVRAEEELKRLSGKLLRSQDEARRRIAQELHDTTGQNLVALTTMLGQLSRSMPLTGRKSRQLLSECKALADQCIREIRTLSYVLHPPVLDEAGLGDAIRDYVKGFTKRSGIQVELEMSPRLGRMPRDVELGLFRVVQESLTNIQRHSGSEQAKIRILRNSDLTLEISDRGRGISADGNRRKEEARFEVGVGIPSMQERVKLIGGRLEIDSTSDGTTVRVTIPLEGKGREKAAHSAG